MEISELLLLSNSIKLDLHGLTRGEAEFELIRALNLVDTCTKGIEVIHGYHGGTVLKKLVRDEFEHPLIVKKIPLDASRTLFELDFSKNKQKKQ